MKLAARLSLIFLTCTLLPLLGVYFIYLNQVQRNLDRLARVQIAANVTSVVAQLDQEKTRLDRIVADLVDRRYLKEALVLSQEKSAYFDQLALIRYTQETASVPGLDELMIIGPTGTVLSRASGPYDYGDSVAQEPYFIDALQGTLGAHLEPSKGGGLFVRATSPVRLEEDVIGVISVGFLTNRGLLKDLAAATGTRLMITDGQAILAGSRPLKVKNAAPLVQRLLGTSSFEKGETLVRVELSGEPFLFGNVPLLGSERYRLLVGASDQKREELAEQLQTVLLGLMAVLAVLGVVVGPVAAGRLLRPIGELVQGAQALQKGDLDHRVTVRGSTPDLQVLIDAFNDMAGSLKTNQEALVQAERRSAWREIGVRIAHEIKNPLTPIQVTLESILRSHRRGDEDAGQHLEEGVGTILREVDRLRHLAQEFSEFSRMPPPDPQPTSVSDVLQKAFVLYQEPRDGVSVTLDIQRDVTLNIDPDQIHAAVVNLINNAIDAVQGAPPDEGGKVTVTLTQGTRLTGDLPQDMALILVSDNGPGIDPGVREKLFDPYRKA